MVLCNVVDLDRPERAKPDVKRHMRYIHAFFAYILQQLLVVHFPGLVPQLFNLLVCTLLIIQALQYFIIIPKHFFGGGRVIIIQIPAQHQLDLTQISLMPAFPGPA